MARYIQASYMQPIFEQSPNVSKLVSVFPPHIFRLRRAPVLAATPKIFSIQLESTTHPGFNAAICLHAIELSWLFPKPLLIRTWR